MKLRPIVLDLDRISIIHSTRLSGVTIAIKPVGEVRALPRIVCYDFHPRHRLLAGENQEPEIRVQSRGHYLNDEVRLRWVWIHSATKTEPYPDPRIKPDAL